MGNHRYSDNQKIMNKKFLIGSIVVAGFFWVMGKIRAVRSLEIRPSLPRNWRFMLPGTVSFELPLTCFNGATSALNIGSVDLKVFAERIYIGRAFSGVSQRILPSGQSVLYVTVYLSLIDMLSNIPGFIDGLKDQTIKIEFNGTMNVEGFYKDIVFQQNVTVPKFR